MITINGEKKMTLEEKVYSLDERVDKLEESGGGGEGTKNYNELNNKPAINGHTLTGNLTAAQLGINDTDTKYTAGYGLELNGTTFSIGGDVATRDAVNGVFEYNAGTLNITTL